MVATEGRKTQALEDAKVIAIPEVGGYAIATRGEQLDA